MQKNMLLALFAFASASCSGGGLDDELAPIDYADKSLVASPDWLNAHLKDEDLVIVDVRSAEQYKISHVSSAINLDWTQFAQMSGEPGDEGYATLLPGNELGEALIKVGITQKTTVVVYGDGETSQGAEGRFVWMLRYARYTKSMLLDGGLTFFGDRFGTSSVPESPKPRNDMPIVDITDFDVAWTARTAWMKDHLDSAQLVDAREQDEFAGAVKNGEARGGHLPGAISLPFSSVFGSRGELLRQKELEQLFQKAGLTKDKPIVVYCNGSTRAPLLTVALRMAGYFDTRYYEDGFWRWAAQSDLEVE